MKRKLSKDLQPVLWSARIEDLDLKEDKVYIIHQILAFGNLRQLKWLLDNYSLKEIKEVFVNHPLKIYRPSSFYFIKEIFLKIKNQKLYEKRYTATPLQPVR